MHVLRILPFDSLSELDLADLRGFIADLGDALEDAGEWLEQDLVVYVTNETEADRSLRRIVAPRSSEIRPGDRISATGWTGTRFAAMNLPTPDRATVHAAHALHPERD
ncbi:MAG: hypothetical protein ACRDQZ_17285 [Mycobacteriales bacterium]